MKQRVNDMLASMDTAEMIKQLWMTSVMGTSSHQCHILQVAVLKEATDKGRGFGNKKEWLPYDSVSEAHYFTESHNRCDPKEFSWAESIDEQALKSIVSTQLEILTLMSLQSIGE